MAEPRQEKKTDQELTQKGYDLLLELIENHPEIEATLWIGVCWGATAHACIENGITHEEFCEECNKNMKFYKQWWDENEN